MIFQCIIFGKFSLIRLMELYKFEFSSWKSHKLTLNFLDISCSMYKFNKTNYCYFSRAIFLLKVIRKYIVKESQDEKIKLLTTFRMQQYNNIF